MPTGRGCLMLAGCNRVTMDKCEFVVSGFQALELPARRGAMPCDLPRHHRIPRRAQRRGFGWIAILAASLIGAAMAFGGEATAPLAPVKFNIPEQSLVDALQAYSMQTGVQVMFETASAAGYRSARVEGEFMPEIALRLLLADTDLRIRYSRTSAVTLAPASAPNPDEPPAHPLASADLVLDRLSVSGGAESGDRGQMGEYISVVQADIQNALKKVAKTRRGDYRVAVKLWVDPSRTIRRAELDGSTGDRDRDGSIAGALQGLVLSQRAPANTPQPIRFMIAVRAL